MIAGVETGGTKIAAAVGSAADVIVDRFRTATGTDPVAALGAVADFLVGSVGPDGIDAVGIGSFGPCDPDPESPTYGHVTSSPKPGWRFVDVVGILRGLLVARGVSADVPIGFDTDVNVAVLAESTYGAARGVSDAVYLTVGTGIGGGAVVGGRLLHGLVHPEMGHIRIARPAQEVERFAGVCPYHGDCWEGVASGPAMAARWGAPAETLPADHPAWALEAAYLAAGVHAVVCTLSPKRVVLGGGVGSAPHLVPLVRPLLVESLGGYIDHPAVVDDMDSYLVGTALHGDAGIVGALTLAAAACPTAEGSAVTR